MEHQVIKNKQYVSDISGNEKEVRKNNSIHKCYFFNHVEKQRNSTICLIIFIQWDNQIFKIIIMIDSVPCRSII